MAAQSPHDLSAYLASMQAKSFPKLSALELEDLRIPGMQLHFLGQSSVSS